MEEGKHSSRKGRDTLYIIIVAAFFVGCSKQNLKTVNLSDDCKLEYTVDENKIVNIKVVQSDKKLILYLSEENEMLVSLSDSNKKCNVILSDDFYTAEISNGQDNICRLNKNCKDSSLDFIVNDDYRTVVQYDVNNKTSEHYEMLENKEYVYKIGKEGLCQNFRTLSDDLNAYELKSNNQE